MYTVFKPYCRYVIYIPSERIRMILKVWISECKVVEKLLKCKMWKVTMKKYTFTLWNALCSMVSGHVP